MTVQADTQAAPRSARGAGVVRGGGALVRRLPAACWACMAIAFVNAVVWASLTPTFQVPDEPVHMGYIEWVGETGKIPRPITPYYSAAPDARAVFEHVPWSLTRRPSWDPGNDAELRRLMDSDLPRRSEAGAGYAANNPPLYYLLAALPYRAAHGGDFLDRMYAVRIFSALLAALTVAFVFLFLRELLPRHRWAWPLGALAVALQPVFGFIGGGANPDNLLWVASAALFWLLARSFRHGLTLRRGVAIGVALLVGMLTKGSMFGLVPGTLLALAVLVWRAPRGARGRPLGAAALALATAAIPMLLWLALSPSLIGRSSEATTAGLGSVSEVTFGGQLSYLWQFYLPKLPFMFDWFEDFPRYPVWDTFFEGFVGRFGWYQFGFSNWVYGVAFAVTLVVVALVVRALRQSWPAVRRRWPELLTYASLAAGLVLLVNVAGYRYRVASEQNFEQARYLFPLLPLYGALVALAVAGAARRARPYVAIGLITVLIAQDVFAQLVLVARYYG
jgi:4-amino-4-deoxy-L-arabinose transferase-like glycosyltransferase